MRETFTAHIGNESAEIVWEDGVYSGEGYDIENERTALRLGGGLGTGIGVLLVVAERATALAPGSQPELGRLAREARGQIKINLARNRNVSSSIIEILAHDDDVVVRRYGALHTSCPKSILELMAEDIDKIVRQRAMKGLPNSKGIEV